MFFSVDSCEKAVKRLRGPEVSFSDVNVPWGPAKSLPLGLSVLMYNGGLSSSQSLSGPGGAAACLAAGGPAFGVL